MSESEEQILELLSAYCRLIDAADYEGVGALFADGALVDPQGREIAHGRDAVAEFYRRTVILYDGSPRTEHVLSDTELEIDEAEGTASSRSKFEVRQPIDGGRGRVAAGRYEDAFKRVEGRWQFDSRQFFLDESRDIAKHVRIAQ